MKTRFEIILKVVHAVVLTVTLVFVVLTVHANHQMAEHNKLIADQNHALIEQNRQIIEQLQKAQHQKP